MLKWLKNWLNKEVEVNGITYGDDKTAYYFETFGKWVSMDEPIVFDIVEDSITSETSLNEYLIKVRDGLRIQSWELQLLEDNHMTLLDMYWGNLIK